MAQAPPPVPPGGGTSPQEPPPGGQGWGPPPLRPASDASDVSGGSDGSGAPADGPQPGNGGAPAPAPRSQTPAPAPSQSGPPPGYGPGPYDAPFPTASPWHSLRGLTTALTVLFWVLAGAAALCLVALVNQRSVADDVAHGNVLDALSRIQHADSGVRGTVGLLGLIVIAIAVVFIIWFWRAAKNNELFGRINARFGPGWSIGAWFIPFANLVIPVLIAQDLWRGSDQTAPPGDPTWRSRPGSAVVGWWWAGFVVSALGRYAHPDAYAEHASSLSSFHAANGVLIAGMIVTIPAAILAIRFVRQLAARQEAFWRRATATVSTAPVMPSAPMAPPPPFPG